MNFAEQYEIYKQNVDESSIQILANDLGRSVTSLETLGVGLRPKTQSWIFAERDAKGAVIGLSSRSVGSGKKFMVEGSNRGLIYPFNPDYVEGDEKYGAGIFTWVQIHRTGLVCPICGKRDWCRVSSDYDHPDGPSAVACSKIRDGSVRKIQPDGHLHILDQERQRVHKQGSVLLETDLPILIVEGASDVLAALDLGFVAIGRPSAEGGMEMLKEMPLAGKEIWILGENDSGAGKAGMEKTYQNIKHLSDNVHCIMPPDGIKDLRQWVDGGLVKDDLFVYVGDHSIDPLGSDTFPDDVAYNIARRYIEAECTINNSQILRYHKGQWYKWKQGHYPVYDRELIRGDLYRFLDGKRYLKETQRGVEISPYKPTRAKVTDILDAFNYIRPVIDDPPTWLDSDTVTRPRQVIAFKNGLLDVDEYVNGKIILHDPTPEYFILATMPYAYDPKAESQLYEDVVNVLFNADDESIRLLTQWFGYLIVPDNRFEKFMLFTGATRSGKGTILETFQSSLGKTQYCGTTFQAMTKDHGTDPMHGKLAVMLGDAKTPRASEAGAAIELMLRIIGNDPVEINAKYAKQFTTKLFCRFTIAMNELPSFSDHAGAMRSRLNLLHFPNCYEGVEDVTLKERLAKDAREGKLINVALRGLKDLYEQGKFYVPDASKIHIEAFNEITNPVLAFIKETCTTGEDVKDYYTSKDQVFNLWCGWCASNNKKPGQKQTFCQRVQNSGMGITSARPRVDGSREQMFKDVKIKSFAKVKYLED